VSTDTQRGAGLSAIAELLVLILRTVYQCEKFSSETVVDFAVADLFASAAAEKPSHLDGGGTVVSLFVTVQDAVSGSDGRHAAPRRRVRHPQRSTRLTLIIARPVAQ